MLNHGVNSMTRWIIKSFLLKNSKKLSRCWNKIGCDGRNGNVDANDSIKIILFTKNSKNYSKVIFSKEKKYIENHNGYQISTWNLLCCPTGIYTCAIAKFNLREWLLFCIWIKKCNDCWWHELVYFRGKCRGTITTNE